MEPACCPLDRVRTLTDEVYAKLAEFTALVEELALTASEHAEQLVALKKERGGDGPGYLTE